MKKTRYFTVFACALFMMFSVISFVYCYNWQESEKIGSEIDIESTEAEQKGDTYILNTSSMKIHKTTCGTGKLMLPENRRVYVGDIEDLLINGYTKCGNCFRKEK